MMPSIAEDLDRRTFLYNLTMPIMNQLDTLYKYAYSLHLTTTCVDKISINYISLIY